MLWYKYLQMKRQWGTTAVLTCIYSFVTKSHPTAAAININRAESGSYKIIKIPYILTILSLKNCSRCTDMSAVDVDMSSLDVQICLL
jgi:hypothetical protein